MNLLALEDGSSGTKKMQEQKKTEGFKAPLTLPNYLAGCKSDYERALLFLEDEKCSKKGKQQKGKQARPSPGAEPNIAEVAERALVPYNSGGRCNCGDHLCKKPYCTLGEKVKCGQTADRGRGLFAKRSFEKGDVIFAEKAWAFSFGPMYEDSKCSYCTKDLNRKNFQLCQTCETAKYCNRSCKKKAWAQFHMLECGIKKVDVPSYYHLAYRIFIQTPWPGIRDVWLEEMQAQDGNKLNREGSVTDNPMDVTYSQSYRFVYNLDPGTSKCTEENFERFYKLAYKLLKFYEFRYNQLYGAEPRSAYRTKNGQLLDERALRLAVIARHAQQCYFHNMTALDDKNMIFGPDSYDEFAHKKRYNVRVFPIAGLANHSHNCNMKEEVDVYPNGDVVLLHRATEAIADGDELTVHYGNGRGLDEKAAKVEDILCQCKCKSCLHNYACPSCMSRVARRGTAVYDGYTLYIFVRRL